jgi:hypothetical protein
MAVKKTIKKKATPTEDELFLGIVKQDEIIEEVDYENPSVFYEVTNLKNDNRKTKVSGRFINSFIGLDADAREKIKKGEKLVTITDKNGIEELYKIEVID